MTNDAKKQKNAPTKPRGRSFCCSMFIYTFVFVSGVVVATLLPDLAGHHFKQPYGKEYGVMAEQIFKDLPKYLNRFRETALLVAGELGNRLWDLKTEVERRIAEFTAKPTPKSTGRTGNKAHKDHNHGSHKHSANDEEL